MRLDDLYRTQNRTTVRVTYRDTDQMGVVYYANHLVWFEIGRSEFVRELGLPYRQMEAAGVYLPVVAAQVTYRAPARYDDLIEIRTRVTKLSHASIAFDYEIVRRDGPRDTVIAQGSTRHAFTGPHGEVLTNGFDLLNIER